MTLKKSAAQVLHGAKLCLATVAMVQFSLLGPLTSPAQANDEAKTKSPIKHVIVIVGENVRSHLCHVQAEERRACGKFAVEKDHQGRRNARDRIS
jgi:hypothetical protein